MNSAPSQSLINLLLQSGVSSQEEAAQLATNLNGGSWVSQVLDSGKVDEQRFLSAIGNFFRVPIVSVDAKKNRARYFVDSAEPFRISTSHSADRDERKLGGAGDLRSFQFDRAPACGAAVEKTRRMGARAARAASARHENSLWRWRGDVRRDSEDQGFHGRAGGHRDRD